MTPEEEEMDLELVRAFADQAWDGEDLLKARRLLRVQCESIEALGGMVEFLAEMVVDAREVLDRDRRDYLGDFRGVLVGKVPVQVDTVLAILDRERNADPSRYDQLKAENASLRELVAELERQA